MVLLGSGDRERENGSILSANHTDCPRDQEDEEGGEGRGEGEGGRADIKDSETKPF